MTGSSSRSRRTDALARSLDALDAQWRTEGLSGGTLRLHGVPTLPCGLRVELPAVVTAAGLMAGVVPADVRPRSGAEKRPTPANWNVAGEDVNGRLVLKHAARGILSLSA